MKFDWRDACKQVAWAAFVVAGLFYIGLILAIDAGQVGCARFDTVYTTGD